MLQKTNLTMYNIENIKRELNELSNESIAEHSQRFFKTGKGEYGEGDKFLGIRVPLLRKLAKKYKTASIQETTILLQSKFHEKRLLSLLILLELYRKSDYQKKEKIFNIYLANTQYINNWDLVDSSAEHIIGAHLWKTSKIVLYNLAHSKSLWER